VRESGYCGKALLLVVLGMVLLTSGALADTAEPAIYIASQEGLFISTDGGATFVTRTTADGLASDMTRCVLVHDGTVLVGTTAAFSISYDGGISFATRSPFPAVFPRIASLSDWGDTLYAADESGFVYASEDAGETYARVGRVMAGWVYALTLHEGVLYAATGDGLMLSHDGGVTFEEVTEANGLGSSLVYDVFADASGVYAATSNGLSVSLDGGTTFVTYRQADGLAADRVICIRVASDVIYVGTAAGLSMSSDGGETFVSKTQADGLAEAKVQRIAVRNGVLYVIGLNGGLSLSYDGGETFITPTADGLLGVTVTDMAVE